MREVTLYIAVTECRDMVRSGFGLLPAARMVADRTGADLLWLLAMAGEAELACALARADRFEQLAERIHKC